MKKITSILVTMMLLTVIGASLNASAGPFRPAPPDKPIIEGDITEVETSGSYAITVKTSRPDLSQVVHYHVYINDEIYGKYYCDDLEQGVTFSVSLEEGHDYEIKAKAVSEVGRESFWSPILELKEEDDAASHPVLRLNKSPNLCVFVKDFDEAPNGHVKFQVVFGLYTDDVGHTIIVTQNTWAYPFDIPSDWVVTNIGNFFVRATI